MGVLVILKRRSKVSKGFKEGFNVIIKVNPIPTRLCHVIYCHSDKSYPCLVGIGLNYFSKTVIERQNDLSN